MSASPADPRRRLPAVEALLAEPDVAALLATHPRSLVLRAVRETIDAARADGGAVPPEGWGPAVRARAHRLAAPSLGPVINATGVVLHTNLGRAPLAPAAIAALRRIAGEYSNLEYDVAAGSRGSRHALCRGLLLELTGAADALVVNNAAGALLLALSALARAVRSDKFTLAALEATLALYRDPGAARQEIPVLRMLTENVAEIRQRGEALQRGVGKGTELVEGESEVGGGSFPGKTLKTWLVQLTSDRLTSDVLATRLRGGDPPIIARIADDRVVLDPRTIFPHQIEQVARAVRAALDA